MIEVEDAILSTQTARMSTITKSIRLLLIEDNPDDATFIEEVLKLQDSYATVDIARVSKLRDALTWLAKASFDVVLLDLSLPDASSTDSVSRVLAQAPHAPIIVLTGLDDREIALEALKKGAQDYLIKDSISGDLLIRAIRYAVEKDGLSIVLEYALQWRGEDLIFHSGKRFARAAYWRNESLRSVGPGDIGTAKFRTEKYAAQSKTEQSRSIEHAAKSRASLSHRAEQSKNDGCADRLK